VSKVLFFIERIDKVKNYYVYKDKNGKTKVVSTLDQLRELPSFRFVHTCAKSAKGAIKKTRKIL